MIVTFANTSKRTFYGLQATVRWNCAASRDWGEASVLVPIGSDILDERYIDFEGGSFVQFEDTRCGRWIGYTAMPERNDFGYTFRCIHAAELMSHMHPKIRYKFQNMTPGGIAKSAMRGVLIGAGALRLGRCVEAPPTIPEYMLDGHSLSQVLLDLMDKSPQEYVVNDDLSVDWVTGSGRVVSDRLFDGGVIRVRTKRQDDASAVQEVIARDSDGREYRVAANRAAGMMSRQMIQSVNTRNRITLALEAYALLNLHRTPITSWAIEIDGAYLTSNPVGATSDDDGGWGDMEWGDGPWGGDGVVVGSITSLGSIREGDYVSLNAPKHTTNGKARYCRVMSRTADTKRNLVAFDLYELSQDIPANIPTYFINQLSSPPVPAPRNDALAQSIVNSARALRL